ncbi:PASTA domain protein [compost metagenome]|uniref:PASTA domain-containing protein n=1 Tax=Paenibacillus graminis TaxID=189425 RepID=UPI000FA3EE4E|nr:PASTA domain-containing protein [Paenibacillus graminis]MEC0171942.1 PASTA domain-containing protein [Paenibacillus graminis]
MFKTWLLSSFEINLRFRKIYLLAIIGAILVTISLVFVYKPASENPKVPLLVGLSEQEAVSKLESLRMNVNIQTDTNNASDLLKNGTVIVQTPGANIPIEKDAAITITVKNNK